MGRYRILGETLDDAAGEAFDKTAKMLGLPYPGGAALARLAEQGVAGRFVFPRPMLDRPGLEFSFSGLKTAALVALRGREASWTASEPTSPAVSRRRWSTRSRRRRGGLCVLTGHRRLVVAGGVGANRKLRERLAVIAAENGAALYFPRTEFCTDNGAMIALAGCLQLAARAPADHVGQGLGLGARACVGRWPSAADGR